MDVGVFTALPAAGGLFFFSSWLLMVFGGVLADEIGFRPFGYVVAMKATIGLWLVVAPAAGAIGAAQKGAR